MITIQQIETLEQFMALTPLFREGYFEMNKRQQVFDVDLEGFIQTLLGILNTPQKNAIMVAFEGGEPVGFGAAYDNTPSFSKERQVLLWALYGKKTHSATVSAMLMKTAEHWARHMGYSKTVAYNHRFSGAAFKFFEQKCGMRRKQIRFEKTL